MSTINRRMAVGTAITAQAAFVADSTEAKSEDKLSTEPIETAERKRVMTCGLTEAEADCWIFASMAAKTFFDLPKLHPMDEQEVAQAIHVLQCKLLSRPAYRKYQ